MTEISSTTGKANTLGERFFDQGYLFPVDVFSHDEITGYRNSLEDLEQRLKELATGKKTSLTMPIYCFVLPMKWSATKNCSMRLRLSLARIF